MRRSIAALLLALLPALALAEPGTCPALPARAPMPVDAVPAIPSYKEWETQVRALADRLPDAQRETRQVAFIGDSITAGWDPGVFAAYYARRAPLLLGIGGDVTQGVLQRLPGEWGPLRPRLAVLLIGTNNTQWVGGPPGNAALGVAEIVRRIHALSPGTRILLLGILPRGAGPDDRLRAVNAQVNALVARCADGEAVFFADPGQALLEPSGALSRAVSYDLLHLTPAGYGILAAAMEPMVRRLLGE